MLAPNNTLKISTLRPLPGCCKDSSNHDPPNKDGVSRLVLGGWGASPRTVYPRYALSVLPHRFHGAPDEHGVVAAQDTDRAGVTRLYPTECGLDQEPSVDGRDSRAAPETAPGGFGCWG